MFLWRSRLIEEKSLERKNASHGEEKKNDGKSPGKSWRQLFPHQQLWWKNRTDDGRGKNEGEREHFPREITF